MVDQIVTERTEPQASHLEELYLRHAPQAVRVAFLITGDRQVAEDMAQEAFIRVAGRFRQLRFPDAFASYLRRTVVNLCIAEFRKRRREQAYMDQVTAGGGTAAVFPDLESRDELRRALHRLPVRQRAAVVLRYYEDLSEQDVAKELKCSVAAARSLVARAMETLRPQFRGANE